MADKIAYGYIAISRSISSGILRTDYTHDDCVGNLLDKIISGQPALSYTSTIEIKRSHIVTTK